MDFSELEYENGFQATLDDRVTPEDTYIRMTPVPKGDKGHLVLEDTSRDNFEVIRFDSKDAGGVYIGENGARNLDGTSDGNHPRGARVRMNLTKQDLDLWKANVQAVHDAMNEFVNQEGAVLVKISATEPEPDPNGLSILWVQPLD